MVRLRFWGWRRSCRSFPSVPDQIYRERVEGGKGAETHRIGRQGGSLVWFKGATKSALLFRYRLACFVALVLNAERRDDLVCGLAEIANFARNCRKTASSFTDA